MKLFLLISISLLALACPPAFAGDPATQPAITVERLASICSGTDKTYGEEYCFGYIQSLNDLYVSELTVSNPDYHFCPPNGVTLGHTRDLFVKWASVNPGYANIAGVGGVFIALIKAYPCNPAQSYPTPGSGLAIGPLHRQSR